MAESNHGWAAVGVATLALITSAVLQSCQLQASRDSLLSNLIFTMQKDMRAAGVGFEAGNVKSDEIFAVMQAVHLQHELKNLNAEPWKAFVRNICVTMTTVKLKDDWVAANKKYFTSSFAKFMDDVVLHGTQ